MRLSSHHLQETGAIILKRTSIGPVARRNKKIRVNQLARELGVPNKTVLQLLKVNGLSDAAKTHMSALSEGLAATIRQWLVRRTSPGIATQTLTPAPTLAESVPTQTSVNPIEKQPRSLLLCWLEQLDAFVQQRQPRIVVTESWSIIEERLKATFLSKERRFGEGFAKNIVQDSASKSPGIQRLATRIQSLRKLRNRAEHDRYDPPMSDAFGARDLCRQVVEICATHLDGAK